MQAQMMMTRSLPVSAPMARASSSPNERGLRCQRTMRMAAPPTTIGPSRMSTSWVLMAARLPISQKVMAGSLSYGSASTLSIEMSDVKTVPTRMPVSTRNRVGIAAAQPPGEQVGDHHRAQAETEGQELRDDDALRQHDAEGGAEARAGRGAEDVGRHQRVAEHALVGRARQGEPGPDEERDQDAGQAHVQMTVLTRSRARSRR